VIAMSAAAWTWPADGLVLQPFAFDPAHPYAAGQHRGIDVAGAAGTKVRAPAGGVVSFAGTVPASGRTLTIETADGWSVTLTHLGSIHVKKGATVAEGDGVGTIGPSGEPDVSEPYVHLGIRRTAEAEGYVDPVGLLPARVAAPPALVPAAPAPAPGGAGGAVPEASPPPAPAVAEPAAPAPTAVLDPPAAPSSAEPAVPDRVPPPATAPAPAPAADPPAPAQARAPSPAA